MAPDARAFVAGREGGKGPPKSDGYIGKAAAYVVANWVRLTRFLDDPRIPLDNNATERAIRGPVVGRKNHYGSKSRRGTEVAAIFYTHTP
jgi:Transposase IS66 family